MEAGGIGYSLLIPFSAFTKLPANEENVLLFLSHIVREDSETLYGFFEKEERDLFEKLLAVSGIGPKTALAIVGHIDQETFHQAIQRADILFLSKIPGIGKKTAERVILEMRDKIDKTKASSFPSGGSLEGDAINALCNLGYPFSEAKNAVFAAMKKEAKDLGKIITTALQSIH